MEFRVLGPLQVIGRHGVPVDLPSASQRRLACLFLVRAGSVLSADYLGDALELSPGALRTTISRLRRVLGFATLVSVPPGYQLRADVLDAAEFERRLAIAAADPAGARRLLKEALALWRGEAYAEFAHEEWAVVETSRLAELHSGAVESLVELQIADNEFAAAIAHLEPLIAAHPFRDRPRGLLMTALADSGRRTDALRAFQDYRTFLIEEIGTEPSAELVALDRAIASPTTPASPAPRPAAASLVDPPRTSTTDSVVVLFTDMVDSTGLASRLAPDIADEVRRSHFAILRQAVADAGGTEVKSLGDGLMVVFASTSAAMSCAVAMQQGVERHNLDGDHPVSLRVGLSAGDVTKEEGDYFGAAVVEASRLCATSEGGQILAADVVRLMVGRRGQHEFAAYGPLQLKGLPDPVETLEILWREVEGPGTRPPEKPSNPSTDATPTNLPVRLSTFIGREPELAALAELQIGHRLVTITGSGGVGKTSLALQSAWDQLARFHDGVWWLELAPLAEGAQVAAAAAGVLGARVDEATSAEEAVTRRLADDNALMVLDNCEHLTGTAARLAAALLQNCPNVSILATSRCLLGVPGEKIWRVPPLSFPPVGSGGLESDSGEFDAIRLFVDRARRVRPHFVMSDDNQPVVAEICQRLDGIPLAIELAAARTKALTVGQIFDGLGHRLKLLTGGASTSPLRQQTLEASIAWSVDLLNEGDKALLFRLSVFSGSFDLDALEAVCHEGDHEPEVLQQIEMIDSLERLIDHSLVHPLEGDREGRFMQLETVRQFGAERLDTGGESTGIRHRHAAYFRELAETVAPRIETADELVAVARLDADIDNLRTALIWYREKEEADTLAQLACDLASYWSLTGAMTESLSWLTCALDLLSEQPSVIKSRLTAHRASVRGNIGDYSGSVRDCNGAIAMGEAVGDPWSVGRARWVLADLAAYVDLDMWRPLSERCVDALIQSGDRFALAYARLWQAVPYLMRGYQPQGIAALGDAASGVADIANPTLNASYVIWQGWAALQAGELRRADQLATEVMAGPGFRLATQRLFGELLLAAAARHRGVYEPILDEFPSRAASALRHGEILAAVMYRHWEAFCLLFSDPPAARHRAEETIALYGSAYGSVACALHLTAALAALAMGDGNAAWSHSDTAEAFTAPMRWPLNRTRQLLVRAMLLGGNNDVAAARATAVEQVVLAHEQGLAIELVYGLEALAVIADAADALVDTARLLGVTTKMRGTMEMAGEFLPLSLLVGKSVERAHETLGPVAFATALAAGAALTPAEAVAGLRTPPEARNRRRSV